MKVKIGPYVDYFGSWQLATKLLFWKNKNDDSVNRLTERLENSFIGKFLRWFNERKTRKISIKIDNYDVWNADNTLAIIILPVLIKLKETKNGSPVVDDEDVPESFRELQGDAEKDWTLYEKRWAYVLDEMIWAFDNIVNDRESMFYYGKVTDGTFGVDVKSLAAHNKRIDRGLALFGKYYRCLWD